MTRMITCIVNYITGYIFKKLQTNFQSVVRQYRSCNLKKNLLCLNRKQRVIVIVFKYRKIISPFSCTLMSMELCFLKVNNWSMFGSTLCNRRLIFITPFPQTQRFRLNLSYINCLMSKIVEIAKSEMNEKVKQWSTVAESICRTQYINKTSSSSKFPT